MRVFSFGLGSGCDKHLVTHVARAGRGTYTLVKDKDPQLSGLVIKALASAMEPSLCDTRYGFNDELSEPEELYRNSLVLATKLMTQEEFANLKFSFMTKAEDTQEALNLEFSRADFQRVQGGTAAQNLFKFVAFHEIEKLKLHERERQKELSLKYQVLCF